MGSFTQKFLSILLLPIYTRYLDTDDYGVIALITILILILSTLSMCGLTNGISRYFYYTEQENTTKDEVIWSSLLFIVAFSIFLID